jgi:hypothetical protein
MKAYTLKRRKDTKEYYLFEGDFANNTPNCSSNQLSICNKMNEIESDGNAFKIMHVDKYLKLADLFAVFVKVIYIQPINLIAMRKLFVIVLLAVFTISVNAQEKKSKTYNQHRSAKTGRYVTKSETKKSPSTTYTTKRKSSKSK